MDANIDSSQLASILLEDATAKLPSKKAEIRILPARGLDLHHDVVLISDRAPLYIGTIGPKHSVWRVIKTAPNVGRLMRTQLHWHEPTKEECAIRMAEVMRPYWKPIIERHGFMDMFENNEVDFKNVLDRVRNEFSHATGVSPAGWDCSEFAKAAKSAYPSVRLWQTPHGSSDPWHVWIEHQGKHYDAECQDGVLNWSELPIFKDAASKAGPLQTSYAPKVYEDTKAEIEVEAEKAEKPASDEQAEAGNYQKGHVSLQGMEIAIENAKGSTRSGVNKAGESWSVTLPAHYGYIKGTVGKDKDHLDVYIGDSPGGMLVFVVNQKKEEGGFDEHKIMLGFSSKDEAIAAYDRAFTGDLGPKLRESVVSTTVDKLKDWLKSGNTKKPFENLAESIVDSLLEDEEFSLEDIKDYVAGQKVSLADGIEFHIGFAIGTSGQEEIESNVEFAGLPPGWPSIDWEEINNAVQRIEVNAVSALSEAGINCQPQGHGDSDELVGSCWVTGGTPGFALVLQQIEHGERFSNHEGNMPEVLTRGLYVGIAPEVAQLIGVTIEFFDTDKIEHVENGGELEEDEHAEDPKEFMTRAFTFDVGELKERLLTQLDLGSVVIHTVRLSSGALSLYLYAAKKPVSQDKWDRENRIAGNEDGAISRIVYDWIERKGGLLLDREYLVCRKHFQKFAEYRLMRFMFRPPTKTVQIVGDDNDRTVF